MRLSNLCKASALAVPLGLAGAGAHAADISATAQEEGFNIFAKAVEAAGMSGAFESGGPYTVFAPTDQAFNSLPQGALDELMKKENQEQLRTLLEHHVVEGREIKARDAIGQQSKVDTLSGDSLTVDGTGQVVMLVPTGLTITRVGDEVVVQREAAAVTTPAVEVQSQTVRKSGDSQQQAQGQQGSGRGQPQAGGQDGAQQQATGQTPARTQTSQQGDMPMSEHQQQTLGTDPQQEQQQTGPQGTAMPTTEHQRQVLAEKEIPGEQQQSHEQARVQGTPDVLREATVVRPDIQADNGVIHGIDAVLVPEKLLSQLEGMQSQSQSQGQQPGQSQERQGGQG